MWGDRLPKRHFDLKTIMAIAVAMMVFGPVAAATVWGPGTYGLGYGSVSWSSQDVSANKEVVQLGGYGSQASLKESTVAAMQLGNNSSQVSSQEQTAATVQLGSGGSQLSSQAPASGAVQLSGYHDNMGSYTNIFYPSIMLGGTFGSAGGGGGCCSG